MPSATRPLAKAKVATSTNQLGRTRASERQRREGEQRGAEGADTAGHQIFRAVVRWNRPSGRNASTSAITR